MDRSGPPTEQRGDVLSFTADSPLRRPRTFLRTGVQRLRASVRIGRRLFVRDLRAQYRQSLLGYLWIFIPAGAQALLWIFLSSANIVNTGDTGIPYVAFVVTGVLLWQGFFEALLVPSNSLREAAAVLTRIRFPAEAVLLSAFGIVVVSAAVRLLVLVPVYVAYGVEPGAAVVLAPVGVLVLLVAGFATGLVLAPFGVLYHDVPRGLVVGAQFLFLATPIAYAEPTNGFAESVLRWNPLAPLITTTRSWLTGGPVEPSTSFLVVTAATAVLLLFAWTLLRVAIPHLVDRADT
ncbi:hypothetical protein B7486_54230 [cyanobacterium TDX16]|nr:hypothetical protein B7486_54230 [cyanobacterium TDX16]